MLQHYLKIAFRQILKNKTQYLLSVIGIAIGILCFSITSYYIRRYNNQFNVWPNSDRIAKVYVKSIGNNRPIALLPGKELLTLISNPPAGIEKISYTGDSYTQANITFIKEDKKESFFQCSFQNTTPDFIDIFSLRAIDGGKPSLNPGEVLIEHTAAKKIFGNENPVGKALYFTQADNDTTPIRYSTISSVIEDLPEGSGMKHDLYFRNTADINPDREYWNSTTVLLSKGVSSKEINKRLQKHIPPFGEKNGSYIIVKTLKEEMMEPDNLTASILIPLIGALVLIAAMINFLKFCIQSFYNRTRELSLRKSLGADIKGLFYLLFSEIVILFLLSALFCLTLTELLTPVIYQYMLNRHNIDIQEVSIDIPTLIRQEGEYLCLLFILCFAITIWTIMQHRNNSIIEGVKGGKRHKSAVRNFMLGVQLFICILFIGGTIGLNKFHHHLTSFSYNTLMKEECSRIWKINLWAPQLRGHEEEIITQIRTLAGVEDILMKLTRTSPSYKTSKDEEIRGTEYCVSRNYAQFMKLPIEGRMPEAPNEILASRSLIWELENEGERNPSSVLLGDKVYQITGVFEQIPFKTVYTKEQADRMNPYERFAIISLIEKPAYTGIYIKCSPGQEKAVRKDILRIVRARLAETIPFEPSTLEEERIRYYNEAIIISDIFTFLSIISLSITILGIYSAITLDTRNRQKEVAIRKINGAGPKTIALLFGKLYIRLLVISAIPALLIVYLFLNSLNQTEVAMPGHWLVNPFMWLEILLLTSGIVFITVAARIRQIARLNPAEIIKAE